MWTSSGIWRDRRWWRATFFPEREIYPRSIGVVPQILLFAAAFTLFSVAARLLPVGGFIGFDWYAWFGQGAFPPFYPPWVRDVMALFTWPTLTGLTMAAVTLAVVKRSAHVLSAIFALLALPFLWTVFLGQLGGVAVLGLLALPWLTPLALVKPQVSVFGLLARPTYFIGLLVFVIISFILWGLWPLDMLGVFDVLAAEHYVQDIALKWWGLPLAFALLWWSRGDMDMLMLAGSFGTLTLIPYNLLPATPAIARLRPRAALVASLASWLPLSANWLGPGGWWLGWVFVGFLWATLAVMRYYPNLRLSDALYRFVV